MFALILIPIIVTVITQAIKLTTDGIPKNLNFQHMISDYGGMPSSHTAYVASLATVVGLSTGFDSPAFAVAFVLMVIVIRDAIGFRREIGRNAVFTNLVAKEVFKKKDVKYLTERIGHTVSEVTAGFILGVVLSAIIFWII